MTFAKKSLSSSGTRFYRKIKPRLTCTNSHLSVDQKACKARKKPLPVPGLSAGASQGGVLSLHSSHPTQMTAPQETLLSKWWSLQKTWRSQASSRTVMSRTRTKCKWEVKQLALWCSRTNLELNTFKTVEMKLDLRRSPLHCPLTLLDSTVGCRNLKVSGIHIFPGPEVGFQH